MTRARTSRKTAPHRRMERKYGKSKRQNRNRNKNHRNRNEINHRQSSSSSNQPPRKTSSQLDVQQSPQRSPPRKFRFHLPLDLIQEILTFVSINDLSTSVRTVSIELRDLTSTDNTWMRNKLDSHITPPTYQNQINPFKKVILLVTKNPEYGRTLHRLACKMKRQGPIDDTLYFRCSAVVFSHENGNLSFISDGPSAWHLITMSCNFGMEILTGAYLLIYLEKKGLDENNMTEDGRSSVRNDYLVYRKTFLENGVRFIEEKSDSYFSEEIDDYDLESDSHPFEESKDDDNEEREDRIYPPCALAKSKSFKPAVVDPLAMMITARNGEMARRIVRLFVDFENGVPPETAKHCRRTLQFYIQATLIFSDPDNIGILKQIISNLYSVEPLQTRKCSWILMNFAWQVDQEGFMFASKWMRTVHGYDKHFDFDEWAENRIICARALVPFAISKIDPDLVPQSHVDELIRFVESEGNPMVECVPLRDEVKRLFLPLTACFASKIRVI